MIEAPAPYPDEHQRAANRELTQRLKERLRAARGGAAPRTDDLSWFDRYCAEHPVRPEPPEERPKRQRKPTLSRMLREASKAGVSIRRIEAEGDRIALVVGEPEPNEPASDLDKWIAKNAH